jgi:lipopolysaccharide biosynthesis glycosyltransferase
VLDSVPENLKANFLRQYPHVAHRECFNGGLFAVECAAWRDLPERYEAALAEGGYSESYHPILDQPLFNGIFDGHIEWLPMQFNVSNLFDTRIPHDTRVLHYTGGKCKPWDARYPRHEPQWHWWLKHGVGEKSRWRLLLSWLRVALWTPKRELSRFLRRRREAAGPT